MICAWCGKGGLLHTQKFCEECKSGLIEEEIFAEKLDKVFELEAAFKDMEKQEEIFTNN